MSTPRIPIPRDAIDAFCRKWKITEFAFFGSVVRDDFGPDSDVDVLVSFEPDARHTLLDLVRMERQLGEIFGRDVDIVTRSSVERSTSEWRRQAVLGSLSHVPLAP